MPISSVIRDQFFWLAAGENKIGPPHSFRPLRRYGNDALLRPRKSQPLVHLYLCHLLRPRISLRVPAGRMAFWRGGDCLGLGGVAPVGEKQPLECTDFWWKCCFKSRRFSAGGTAPYFFATVILKTVWPNQLLIILRNHRYCGCAGCLNPFRSSIPVLRKRCGFPPYVFHFHLPRLA